ncbi:hypothetical protein [Blastococcus sp. SYSU DS0539]
MSSVMENRAAVFAGQSQAVEVYQAGAWWAGELLGWRHDDAGACQVWVRVVVGGVEETAWTELSTLRLPEPHTATPEVAVVAAPRVTQDPAVAQAVSALHGGRPAGAGTTASLPLVRDHRERSNPARGGGRRRAPEDSDVQADPAASVPAPPPGRHRAPAPEGLAGRHRAADTGLIPVVPAESGADVPAAARDDHPRTVAWSVPPARSVHPVVAAPGGRGWTPPADIEADLLTRPMRLSDQIPHSRRPRVDAR